MICDLWGDVCARAKSQVVVNVETEEDIERLRNAARLLAEQNERLTIRIQRLVAEIKRLKGSNQDTQALEREVNNLKEQVATQRDALFGDSSEKSSTNSDEDKVRQIRPQLTRTRTRAKRRKVMGRHLNQNCSGKREFTNSMSVIVSAPNAVVDLMRWWVSLRSLKRSMPLLRVM